MAKLVDWQHTADVLADAPPQDDQLQAGVPVGVKIETAG